ncbi:beta-ketoacyl-[acyl-carrier-protein] synthase family protein [Thiolapillus sp.]
MRQPVAITGLGCISSLGNSVADNWAALADGSSAIRPLSGFEETDLKVASAAQVQNYSPEAYFQSSRLGLLDRHSQFALVAAREAVEDAGLDPPDLAASAAIIGTGCGGKETDEITYQKLYQEQKPRVHPFTIPRGMPSAASSQISMELGIQGPSFTLSSACASSNHAVAQAVLMIRSGMVDLAIAGGADAPFTYGLLKSWEALRVLSPDTCRPFSADRKGLVLGEGAGMVVLESLEHARRRGAVIHALISGIGMSADASHITDPSSEGAARAMQAALDDAALAAEEVAYINAHGTGTRQNDPSETAAIRQVFGNHAGKLLVSSSKSMHGHALGAAGAIELIATVLSLKQGLIPPTANFTSAGEGCDLDYVANRSLEMEYDHALSNSFAFGGLNAVLAVSRTS